jgi:hypothetical protein
MRMEQGTQAIRDQAMTALDWPADLARREAECCGGDVRPQLMQISHEFELAHRRHWWEPPAAALLTAVVLCCGAWLRVTWRIR